MFRKIIIFLLMFLIYPFVANADYKGQTFVIPCDKGGVNYSQNIDLLPPTAMIGETRNLNLHNNGREKRGGTSISDATITSSQIMWIYKYRLKSGTENLITADIDGKLYEDGNLLSQGMAVGNYYSGTTFNDKLFIADGSNIPHVWNGSDTVSRAITSPHVNWSDTAPFQVLSHKRGNSQRVVMVNVDAVYLSSSAAGGEEDFSSLNAVKIAIETNDGLGLQGCAGFGDRLICFGKTKAYRLDDSSSDSDNWGFYPVQWTGGVVNWRCIVDIDNNIVLMADDGTVYDVASVEQYGDYLKSSLTRPAKIDRWITDNVNLGQSVNFHGIYDPNLRAVKYFVWRKNRAQVDTALVFFVDRGPLDGWMLHSNRTNASGYDASVSAEIRESDGARIVYTGDYSGRLWKLEQEPLHDNANSFYAGWSGLITFGDIRREKQVDNLWVSATEEGDYIVSISTKIDGQTKVTYGFSMLDANSTALVIGSATRGIIGTNTIGDTFTSMNVPINVEYGNNGVRFYYDVFTNSTTSDFFMKAIMVDFKPLGRRPD
jgi:hypothetical protein